ncbi:MAG: metalloprotease [Hyalangium sp.]|uniref:metalloprotease n=1 Tax=Hyalangium sp. TaxID=2028555 RepID=UPI00389A47F2
MALRFQVAGFPVQVHLLFVLTTLALGWTESSDPARLAVWFSVVFVSVLLHELGHALAFRRFGHGASISLHGMGGTTTSEGGRPLTHRQDLWISLAGPGAGFLLGGLVLALQHFTHVGQGSSLAHYSVVALLWVNIGWGVFNLLPVLPLDGGHVMAAIVRERGGPRFEWLIPAISLATAACGLVLSLLWKQRWLGMFALMLAVSNAGQLAQAWMERRYALRIRASLKRVRPTVDGAKAPSVDRLLTELSLPSRYTAPEPGSAAPPERQAPPPERHAPPPKRPDPPQPSAALSEPELPEMLHDPWFVGELLLSNDLPELAIRPLSAAFYEVPTVQRGHALVTALLEAGRYADLLRTLSTPSQRHLGDETLLLIVTRAETAAQPALAARARELRQGRARSKPLPSRSAHDSKKPG